MQNAITALGKKPQDIRNAGSKTYIEKIDKYPSNHTSENTCTGYVVQILLGFLRKKMDFNVIIKLYKILKDPLWNALNLTRENVPLDMGAWQKLGSVFTWSV